MKVGDTILELVWTYDRLTVS